MFRLKEIDKRAIALTGVPTCVAGWESQPPVLSDPFNITCGVY